MLSGEAQFSGTITSVPIRRDDEAFEWKTLQNPKENLYYYYYYHHHTNVLPLKNISKLL